MALNLHVELERLVMGCKAGVTHVTIGCDADVHHTLWGSANINNRGDSMSNYIMDNGLHIMNRVNRPSFVTSKR
jgi:hypothetical protein